MAKKTKTVAGGEFFLFDVFYEDGGRTSNRRVPTAEIDELNREGSIRAIIEAQDRKVAEMSGRPRGRIKSIAPVAAKAAS